MSDGREKQYFNASSPEIDADETWREFRRLLLVYIEDLKENQDKQEIDLKELTAVVMEIKIDQKVVNQKHYYINAAIGFLFGVIGYAIQFYFFTK